ncbi:hypothetical protein [Streptococcus hyovaginalis]|uniref:hypothetical protein n=1 Tax=Streptococcus hyovaginalis TaxID=149015 RepID=UPI002A7ED105|nr:hypothetical protein [Streptococcus hyovaginalis]
MIKIIGYDKEKNRNEKVEVKDLTIAELDQVVGGIQVTWHDYMMFSKDISSTQWRK